jgi:hypothetical protein
MESKAIDPDVAVAHAGRRGKAKNLREFICEPGVVEVDRATSPTTRPVVLKHHGYTGETLAARAKRSEVHKCWVISVLTACW